MAAQKDSRKAEMVFRSRGMTRSRRTLCAASKEEIIGFIGGRGTHFAGRAPFPAIWYSKLKMISSLSPWFSTAT